MATVVRILPHGLYGPSQIESSVDGQSEGVLSTVLSHGPRHVASHGQETVRLPAWHDLDVAHLGAADAHAHSHPCHHDGRWHVDPGQAYSVG